MTDKTHTTACGTIHYWINEDFNSGRLTLVFLPGLTADHRLFEKQLDYFEGKQNIFVWDAPAHASSWPFSFDFTLTDKAKWLNEIFIKEGIDKPIIIGQSMGGYVGQTYAGMFPDKLRGFISVDSAPLQRCYLTRAELWMLKHTELMYRYYPWKALLKTGSNGVATTAYGRALMREMMLTYEGDQRRYAKLAGHGFKILAEAIENEIPAQINCPALLICGEEDRAGSAIRYNKAWHKNTGLPIQWIPKAGHNSNTDAPELVNGLIANFIEQLT